MVPQLPTAGFDDLQEFGFALSPSLVFDFPNVRALEVGPGQVFELVMP